MGSLKKAVKDKKLAIKMRILEGEERTLEATKRMQETSWGEVVPRTDYPWNDVDGFGNQGASFHRIITSVDDRTEGKFYPVYRDEFDLRRMRNKHRAIFHFVSIASGLVESLIDYTIGEGFTIEIQPRAEFKDDQTSKQLAMTMQSVTDELLDSIGFHGDRDRDLVQTPVSDGELFWSLFPDKFKQRDGFPKLRNIEPDEITEPSDPYPVERWLGTLDRFESFWKFGVHTKFCQELKKEDVEDPQGYHVVYDDTGADWDYIPASRMVHIKRNVGRRAKRGVSDFLATEMTLEKAHKLGGRTADGALAQASIAYIRKWESSKADVEALVSSTFGFNVKARKDNSTEDRRAVNLDTTRIVDVPKGADYQAGPMGQLRSPVFIEVAQYLLRISAARWSMPEFMISGDASNANFASTLVTESPFVKARERDQRPLVKSIKELVWKALKIMWNAGRFRRYANDWDTLLRLIDVMVTAPEVATRDKEKMAAYNQILVQNKVKSIETWTEEEGLDFDQEQDRISRQPDLSSNESFMTNGSANVAGQQPSIVHDEANDISAQGSSDIKESIEAEITRLEKLLESSDNCGTGAGGLSGDSTCATELDDALEANGGFTYQPVDDRSPKAGFAISPFPEAEKVFDGDVSEDQIFTYLVTHREKFLDSKVHAGGWVDTDTGKTYLDLSVIADTLESGKLTAKKFNQEGIYNLASGETIITKDEDDRRK